MIAPFLGMSDRASKLLQRLTQGGEPQLPGLEYMHCDLSGACLRGLRLTGVSLRGVRLDDADLRESQLYQVDLAGASLNRATLTGATLQLVNACGASMLELDARRSCWQQSDFSGADLTSSHFEDALLRGCTLERARLDGAALSHSKLVHCNCDGASFRGATFMWALTGGTTFVGADFSDARRFFLCREILVEILTPLIGDDFKRAQLVGAVLVGKPWCYPQWREVLTREPLVRELAFKVFGDYPDSGFVQALREGWEPPPRPRADTPKTDLPNA